METEFLSESLLPYIRIWTIVIIIYLVAFGYYLWRFKKQNPEIFEPDTTADNPQWLCRKKELQQRFFNKVMVPFVMTFVWMAGIIIIVSAPLRTRQTGMILSVVSVLILFALINIMRKPKE